MKLYIVATPIGNLQDISFRAIDTLKSVDVIACEDTRHTKILLDKYGIKTKLIAYHKFNEKNSTEGIIKLLKEDSSVALVSDAGMPLICDPGARLVERLKEENIEYTVIPGANAMLSALVMSGFDLTKFAFFGFLSEKSKERNETISQISKFAGTSVIYSSKHNINKDLSYLRTSLNDRNICICNEISKVFEKKLFMKLSEAQVDDPSGEYVVVLEGVKEKEEHEAVDLIYEIELLTKNGMSVVDACKRVSKTYDIPKRDLYNNYMKLKNADNLDDSEEN